jgi:Cu(I)/Ag(I) efflux system membrane protein CusA/SilA
MPTDRPAGIIDRVIRFCLEQKLIVVLFTVMLVAWGAMVAPFDWGLGGLPRSPVPVDAIPPGPADHRRTLKTR